MDLSVNDIAAIGWDTYLNGALSTTVQTVKASDGRFGGYYFFNPNTDPVYIQIFDVSGTVTLGTTTPKLSFGVPKGGGANLEFLRGIPFANAIKIAATTTPTGSSAPSSAVLAEIFYK